MAVVRFLTLFFRSSSVWVRWNPVLLKEVTVSFSSPCIELSKREESGGIPDTALPS